MLLDDDHFITEAYVEDTQESSGEQRFPDDFDFDDVPIGQTLLNACRRRADHSEEEGLSSCLSSSVSQDRTGKPVVCRLVSSAQETQRQNSGNGQIRTLLERQREIILADCQAETRKHEFQADYDRRSIQTVNETIERRKLVENRYTFLELTGKIQELQNEIHCMSDSKEFQDAEPIRSGHSHVASQPVFFPPFRDSGGMLSRSLGMPSRNDGPPSVWDTHGTSGNIFCKSSRVFFSTLSAGIESMGKQRSEPIHSSHGNQTPVQDLRCQSGPSAKDLAILSGGDSSKNYGADQQRLHISDLYFDKFPAPATFACWKKRFKTEVCTCSQFST